MVTPVYTSAIPDARAASFTNPAQGNDGQIWAVEAGGFGIEIVFAALGLGTDGIVVPSSWTAAGINNIVGPNLIDDGAGNLWSVLSGAQAFWAYYNPVTTANGALAGASPPNLPVYFCLGPGGDFWGVGGNRAYKYVPFAGSTTHFNFTGSNFQAVCSDGVNSYARDDSGSVSTFWSIDSSGAGTQATPALGGLCQGWSIGADGNIWTCFVSGTALDVYQLSTAGVLLNTFTATLPSGALLTTGSCLGPDGNVWFGGNGILVSVTVAGVITVWSLSETGTAVVNTAGTYDDFGIFPASDDNLYLTGLGSGSTALAIVEAAIAAPPGNSIIMVI